MNEAMVTGRMATDKKLRGGRVLQQDGLNASQAINLLYDRIIEDGSTEFLAGAQAAHGARAWENAARFVDSLSSRHTSRFDSMTKAQIRCERLHERGLM